MKVSQLNEISFSDIHQNVSKKVKDSVATLKSFSKHEVAETGKMIYTVAKIAKSHLKKDAPKPSDEEIESALHQLQDLGKISILIPIFAAPGGGLAIAAAIAYAKKKGINILPTESYKKEQNKKLP